MAVRELVDKENKWSLEVRYYDGIIPLLMTQTLFFRKITTTNVFNNDHNYFVNVFLFNDDDNNIRTLGNISVGIPNDD